MGHLAPPTTKWVVVLKSNLGDFRPDKHHHSPCHNQLPEHDSIKLKRLILRATAREKMMLASLSVFGRAFTEMLKSALE
jgi:hypothetical protein